jgi:hypothetical protein
MNEVKYWFRKIFFIDFLDELGLFIGEKTIFTKKKFLRSGVHPLFERCFQVRNLSFRITGVGFCFWPHKQIPSGSCHRNFWLLFTSMWKIYQFLCFWTWFDVKFYAGWAQKSILYGFWNATMLCNKNLIFSVKKITFSSFYMELEVFFTIIQQTYSKTCFKFY